jgi:glycerophosphoryl diester phosphodiesterase
MSTPSWLTARPIAHRGLHDARAGLFENTLAAAEAAMSRGFGIECDVQLSRDGEAMVFHDHRLDRLTEASGPFIERSRAELETLSIGGTAERIPALSDFLARIGGRVPLVVEIKSRFDGDERLVRRTAELLEASPHPVAVKSFDPAIVALLRRIAPRLRRGIVAQARYDGEEWAGIGPAERKRMARLGHWSDMQPDFISYRYADLPNQAVVMPRILSGIPVMTWTVRSVMEADKASAFADQIVFEGFVPS